MRNWFRRFLGRGERDSSIVILAKVAAWVIEVGREIRRLFEQAGLASAK